MSYPTYLDLKAFLKGRGIDICNDLSKADWQNAVSAAIEQWEYETGWDPFLANSVDETRIIDGPESSMIFPDFGIVSLTSLTIGTKLLSSTTEYWLQHRRPRSGPYMAIELAGYATGERRSVTLVGKFGYALTVPQDARDAILAKVAYDLYSTITGIEGEVRREKQGPVEYEYQTPTGSDAKYQGTRGGLVRSFDEAVARYKRPYL